MQRQAGLENNQGNLARLHNEHPPSDEERSGKGHNDTARGPSTDVDVLPAA
jgi:hypothetical protein